jgi:hypothetical protein
MVEQISSGMAQTLIGQMSVGQMSLGQNVVTPHYRSLRGKDSTGKAD